MMLPNFEKGKRLFGNNNFLIADFFVTKYSSDFSRKQPSQPRSTTTTSLVSAAEVLSTWPRVFPSVGQVADSLFSGHYYGFCLGILRSGSADLNVCQRDMFVSIE